MHPIINPDTRDMPPIRPYILLHAVPCYTKSTPNAPAPAPCSMISNARRADANDLALPVQTCIFKNKVSHNQALTACQVHAIVVQAAYVSE